MKEGRKPEHPEKTPDDKLQKMPMKGSSGASCTSTEQCLSEKVSTGS